MFLTKPNPLQSNRLKSATIATQHNCKLCNNLKHCKNCKIAKKVLIGFGQFWLVVCATLCMELYAAICYCLIEHVEQLKTQLEKLKRFSLRFMLIELCTWCKDSVVVAMRPLRPHRSFPVIHGSGGGTILPHNFLTIFLTIFLTVFLTICLSIFFNGQLKTPQKLSSNPWFGEKENIFSRYLTGIFSEYLVSS